MCASRRCSGRIFHEDQRKLARLRKRLKLQPWGRFLSSRLWRKLTTLSLLKANKPADCVPGASAAISLIPPLILQTERFAAGRCSSRGSLGRRRNNVISNHRFREMMPYSIPFDTRHQTILVDARESSPLRLQANLASSASFDSCRVRFSIVTSTPRRQGSQFHLRNALLLISFTDGFPKQRSNIYFYKLEINNLSLSIFNLEISYIFIYLILWCIF